MSGVGEDGGGANRAPSSAEPGMDRRVERAKWRRLPVVWIGGAVLFVFLVSGVIRLIPPPGSLSVRTADVEIGEVQRAPFQDYLPVRAEATPLRTVFVTAISGGQVEKTLVLDGVEVVAGQALAQLSNPQLQLDVTSKEADIAGRLSDASAQQLSLERNRLDRDKEVADTNYNLLKAQHDLDVRQRLHDQGFVSDAEVRTYAAETNYYQDRLKALKSGQQQETWISSAQSAQIQQTNSRLNNSLAVVRSSLEALAIRAPVQGRLTDFTLQSGQSLKAGDQVGQIDSEGQYKLTADIDEYYLARVSPGQKGTADLGGRQLPITVDRVLPQVTSGRFRAELMFEHAPPAPLRRGQNVDIRIVLGDTRPAVVLPNGSWLEAGGGAFAFVIRRGGQKADRRTITIGRRNPDQVEVTSGLSPGEKVVTSSYSAFEKSDHLILH